MKIRNIFLPIIIFIFFNNSFAQELLSLEEAVKIALEKNYSINIAKGDKEIADNNSSIGNAGFLPTLDADASYLKTNSDTKLDLFDGSTIDQKDAKSTNYDASINLNWIIFDGLKMFASLGRLKELRKNGETNFKLVVEDNLSQVISTYFDIVREQQVMEVLRQSIKISEERVKIAEDKKQLGSASKFDLLQAQVDLNEDKSSLLNEELNLKQAKILLNQLMGRNVNENFNVADTILINENLNYDDLKAATGGQNSEIILAEQNKNISDAEINIARSEIFPEISLNAGYDFSKSEAEAGFVKSNKTLGFFYGISARINLFNGLSTRSRIENAQVSFKQSELQLQQVKNKVNADLSNAYEKYKNSIQLVKLETENFSAAQENVEIAVEKLRLGSIAPLEFRETQRQLINAKSRLVAAQFEAKNAETELLKISGQLIKKY